MAASRSLLAILLLSVVAANLVENAVSLPEVSLSARKALNHGDSAGLATTFEEAWSTLRDALQAAAQVLRGSPLSQSSLSLSLNDGKVLEINDIVEFRDAIYASDKIVIEFYLPGKTPGEDVESVFAEFAAAIPEIGFYRLNGETLPDIAGPWVSPSSVPVFVGFNRGDPVKRAGGYDPSELTRLVQSLRRE